MADMKVEIVETQGAVPEPQKVAPVATPAKAEEPKYVRLEDLEKVNQAINNTRDYNNRKLEEINLKLEKLIPKAPEVKPDDLDELVQQNWQLGVEKVVERTLQKRDSISKAESAEQMELRIRQESLAKVVARHKELSDPSSDKYVEFHKVLAENPDFVTNPRGPLLTMYEMENRLKDRGNIELGVEKVTQVKEARSKAAQVPSGTSPGTKSNYSLSKSDLDFCRLNNINPENYKRLKGLRETTV